MVEEILGLLVSKVGDQSLRSKLSLLVVEMELGSSNDKNISKINRVFDDLIDLLGGLNSNSNLTFGRLQSVVKHVMANEPSIKDMDLIFQALGMYRKLEDSFDENEASTATDRKLNGLKKFVRNQSRLSAFIYDSNVLDHLKVLDEDMKRYITRDIVRNTSLLFGEISPGNTLQTGTDYVEKMLHLAVLPATRKNRSFYDSLTIDLFKLCLQRDIFPEMEGGYEFKSLASTFDSVTLNEIMVSLFKPLQERMSFVPKSPDKDRIIVVQNVVRILTSTYLVSGLRWLMENVGVDYNLTGHGRKKFDFKDQGISRRLGRESHSFTIDLASASDSITHTLMINYMPNLNKILRSFSAGSIKIDLEGVEERIPDLKKFRAEGAEEHMYKFPTYTGMGSVFCFQLETLVFYSVVDYSIFKWESMNRKIPNVPKKLNVYGDDIVFADPDMSYEELDDLYSIVCNDLASCGFEVNRSKSCAPRSLLKEVCGQFSYKGMDVRPINLRKLDLRIDALESIVEFSNSMLLKGHQEVLDVVKGVLLSRSKQADIIRYEKIGLALTSVSCLGYLLPLKENGSYNEMKDRSDGKEQRYVAKNILQERAFYGSVGQDRRINSRLGNGIYDGLAELCQHIQLSYEGGFDDSLYLGNCYPLSSVSIPDNVARSISTYSYDDIIPIDVFSDWTVNPVKKVMPIHKIHNGTVRRVTQLTSLWPCYSTEGKLVGFKELDIAGSDYTPTLYVQYVVPIISTTLKVASSSKAKKGKKKGIRRDELAPMFSAARGLFLQRGTTKLADRVNRVIRMTESRNAAWGLNIPEEKLRNFLRSDKPLFEIKTL